MTQERRDAPRTLREPALGHALLPRPQTEDAERVEPLGDWIPHTMGQVTGRRQVDLVPAAFRVDARRDLRTENVIGEQRDHARELAILRRVLNRVSRQGAAVADEV